MDGIYVKPTADAAGIAHLPVSLLTTKNLQQLLPPIMFFLRLQKLEEFPAKIIQAASILSGPANTSEAVASTQSPTTPQTLHPKP